MPACLRLFILSKLRIFQLGEVSLLQKFNGVCRDASDAYDVIRFDDATSDRNCYEKCKSETDCGAFAYFVSVNPNRGCELYRNTHTYTKGIEGPTVTTCYIMPTGSL